MRLQTTPPDPSEEPVYSERFHLEGYNLIQQQVNTRPLANDPKRFHFACERFSLGWALMPMAPLCVAGGL